MTVAAAPDGDPWCSLNRVLDRLAEHGRTKASCGPSGLQVVSLPAPAEAAAPAEPAATAPIAASCERRWKGGFFRLGWLVLVVLASAGFYRSAVYPEWYIDELFAITRNADARGETPLLEVLQHDFWGNHMWRSWTHKSYRPLVTLSYWLQFHLNGYFFKPQPLRVFNCLLNSAVGVAVYGLLRENFLFPRMHAALGAALFAAHPVHTENIVYLVGRADVAACLLLVLACILYTRLSSTTTGTGRIAGFSVVVLFTVASGLCKETGFMGFALFVVYDVLVARRSEGLLRIFVRNAVTVAAFLVVYYLRSYLVGGTHVDFSYVDTPVVYQKSVVTRTLTYFHLHWLYFTLLLFPRHLSWDYSFDAVPMVADLADLRIQGLLSLYTLLTTGIFLGCREYGKFGKFQVLLGLAFLVIPFVPASNLFFTVGTVIGERLLYIPSLGLAVLVPYAVLRTGSSTKPRSRTAALLAVFALLGYYMGKSWDRTAMWRSRVTLFGGDARNFPRSAKTLHQFATTLHRTGHLLEARELYEASLGVFDDNALTDYCIAQIDLERNLFEQAYDRFVKIAHGHGIGFGGFNRFLLLVDFGFACVALAKYDQAVPLLEEGLGLNLDVPHGLNALAIAYAHLGEVGLAVEKLEIGIQYDPGNVWLYNNLAGLALVKGDAELAVQAVNKAIDLSVGTFGGLHSKIAANAELVKAVLEGGERVVGKQPQLELFFHRMI